MPEPLCVVILHQDKYLRDILVRSCLDHGLLAQSVESVEFLQCYLEALKTDLVLLGEEFFDQIYPSIREKQPDLKVLLLGQDLDGWAGFGADAIARHILDSWS